MKRVRSGRWTPGGKDCRDSLIRSRRHFFKTTSGNLLKMRSRNWKRSRRRRTTPDSMPWCTSRWRSAIRIAILGSVEETVEAVGLLEVEAISTISLADTVGVATPQQIRDLVGAVQEKYGYLEIGVHLHSRPEEAAAKILAAYDAGCRRFDSAIGGLGGCPFAQDALVGNIATEKVVEALKQGERSCRH